ncbi:hypothetical protein [Achromobacter pestifer]|uniref:hypothetical protein n=1 Tax=Achromobacter pestifer TaxID=1353889 RepID=UPI001FE73151|nr:hypothetical protein [Achromobacter pestifer]
MHVRWRFTRRVASALLWTLLLLAVAVAVNVLGIRLAGSVGGWQRWMEAHASHFLAWRLLLYASTAWGWIWMRRRLREREPERSARQRMLRAEIAAVLAIMALEISQVVQVG